MAEAEGSSEQDDVSFLRTVSLFISSYIVASIFVYMRFKYPQTMMVY